MSCPCALSVKEIKSPLYRPKKRNKDTPKATTKQRMAKCNPAKSKGCENNRYCIPLNRQCKEDKVKARAAARAGGKVCTEKSQPCDGPNGRYCISKNKNCRIPGEPRKKKAKTEHPPRRKKTEEEKAATRKAKERSKLIQQRMAETDSERARLVKAVNVARINLEKQKQPYYIASPGYKGKKASSDPKAKLFKPPGWYKYKQAYDDAKRALFMYSKKTNHQISLELDGDSDDDVRPDEAISLDYSEADRPGGRTSGFI